MSFLLHDGLRLRPFMKTTISRSAKLLCLGFAFLCVFGSKSASAQLPGFTLSNSGPLTLASQQFASMTLTVTPTGGFSNTVDLNCSNLPVYASCKFPDASASVNVPGQAVSETIIINTSQIDDYQTKAQPVGHTMSQVALCTLFAPAAALLFFARKRRFKGAMLARLLLCAVVLYPLSGLAGCAAVKPLATPPGTYTFLINGTYATISSSTVVTLTVT
jgi:hypothetical protein